MFLERFKLYECVIGSKLYGTAMPDSDIDYLAVFGEPKEMTLGIDGSNRLSQIIKNDVDLRQYWLRRWVMLCAKGNPNVLESLFAPSASILTLDSDFLCHFLKQPNLFLYKNPLVDAHLGFAYAQVKRMDGTNVGAQRKELATQYGYDVKFAAHAYRLVAQLELILTTGKIVLPYPAPIRDVILQIRYGKMTRLQFNKIYSELAEHVKAIVEKCKDLPDDFDNAALNRAVISFYETYYQRSDNI